ncbi:dithiol glutaredoxin GRX1 [Ascoidea rubescens DSM 1968]|uniref:Glutaredoxin n=1 Tax=Ascoidea rubescens DSM 1968 TaxID=1344418 RepID=A0A1D2VR78_9ASCO|nr:glutaredoxin [Ascoidea rubescens DSM 1968]ODV64114.1 glutaredoxin [Ascoidea rubescens DSM 1968]
MSFSKEVLTKVQNLINSNHIFIASKTYCPYCQATLQTFDDLKQKPYVLQLNKISDGSEIQSALKEITNQSTVPNIFIDGKHIGGNSDLQLLKSSGKLERVLKL